ncbi:TPA: antiviral reverse transcriptase Drt2 [Neisseria subflava]
MSTSNPSWYKCRGYLHFDSPINSRQAISLVTSPKKVVTHSFYPFLSCTLSMPKVKKENGELKRGAKEREIAYASHKDSHIFSYYTHILNEKYENLIENKYSSINNSVLAFRKLGKSNIEFAKYAFDYILKHKNCSVIALDISNFFGNIDHNILKAKWKKIISNGTLPPDHFAVFKAITQYSIIKKEIAFKEFGISIHTPRSNSRKQICSPEEFRKFRDKFNDTLFKGNQVIYSNKGMGKGIPQGSPISALLSNIYMIDFDIIVQDIIQEKNGLYMRYCDDILCIIPSDELEIIRTFIKNEIKKLKLDINEKKTEIVNFKLDQEKNKITNDKKLQYLGFIIKDESITIRPTAFTKYSKKMKRGVSLAKQTQRKYNKIRELNGKEKKKIFKHKLFVTYSHLGKRNFVSYGKRAARIMQSKQIRKQLKPLFNRLKARIKDSDTLE